MFVNKIVDIRKPFYSPATNKKYDGEKEALVADRKDTAFAGEH